VCVPARECVCIVVLHSKLCLQFHLYACVRACVHHLPFLIRTNCKQPHPSGELQVPFDKARVGTCSEEARRGDAGDGSNAGGRGAGNRSSITVHAVLLHTDQGTPMAETHARIPVEGAACTNGVSEASRTQGVLAGDRLRWIEFREGPSQCASFGMEGVHVDVLAHTERDYFNGVKNTFRCQLTIARVFASSSTFHVIVSRQLDTFSGGLVPPL